MIGTLPDHISMSWEELFKLRKKLVERLRGKQSLANSDPSDHDLDKVTEMHLLILQLVSVSCEMHSRAITEVTDNLRLATEGAKT